MGKISIGIVGAADIAWRRFLPALERAGAFCFVGVAVSGPARYERAREFTARYGGRVYESYEELLRDSSVDAVYIPQPPSLHHLWAKSAIGCGKHVLLEKPGTTSLADTRELVALAKEAGVALLENYAFCFHRQVGVIRSILESGKLGELRLLRAAFGFPHRDATDFRYNASLGGGALLDCGGYTVKAAQLFLGSGISVADSVLCHGAGHDVDLFGNAVLRDEQGLTAQVSFGMDNAYKCELELWGSRGYLLAPRFFTPPADLEVALTVKTGSGEETVPAGHDDQFFHILERFAACTCHREVAQREMDAMVQQMELVEMILLGSRCGAQKG